MKFMLGRKAGMTQLFDESGICTPVTVIDCGPVVVVQNKTVEVDGYEAVKVGYQESKKSNRPDAGQFKKADLKPMKVLREFVADQSYEVGQTIKVDEMFQADDVVDVIGTSKGKGYTGAIKRHGFSRGPVTHGSKYHRAAGSMGSSATPSKVIKGKKMSGHMGAERVTIQNLKVVKVDGERNILVVKGAVPGPKGGLVEIRTAVKSR